jgi:ribonuclease H / adenosylcobalamin/alpha-ribazole phosphatase
MRSHDRVLGDALVTRLFIIRHAAAVDPDDHRLPGPDVKLLPAGRVQAREVANRMRDLAPSVVYSSDARRAQETGEIIATACQIPLEVNAALGEIDFGIWAGRTYADVVAADPAARAWFTDPSMSAPPGGESLAVAAERVLRVMHALVHGDGERVAIVGHAGSLRLALAQALQMKLSSYWRLRLDCASLSVVMWAADGLLLERLNDTAHLESQIPNLPQVQVTERG